MANVPRIFVSMGSPYKTEQAEFRDSLERFLRDQCKVDPRIMGKNEYPSGSPLHKIKSVMKSCNGVLVVAYERKHVHEGKEKRGSSVEKILHEKAFTTPWNHIESAMAFTLGLPIYIICENNLVEEGLIEDKIDWYVQKIEISKNSFQNDVFTCSIRNWILERVVPFSRKPKILESVQGSLSFSDMTPADVFGAVAVLGVAFSAGVAAALNWPKIFG